MADLAVPPTELSVPPGELAVPPGELAVPPGELPMVGGGPPDRLTDADVELALTRVEELLTRLETVPGPTAEVGLEAVAALTDVYGEALAGGRPGGDRQGRASRAWPPTSWWGS